MSNEHKETKGRKDEALKAQKLELSFNFILLVEDLLITRAY